MVLTNFEFWAADSMSPSFETDHHTRHLNPFDTRVVPHVPNRNLTHLSSNGYYGYGYINATHDLEQLNNNNNNNIDITNNNNNSSLNLSDTNASAHNFMGNHVNGAAAATPPAGNSASRCKKRFFVVTENECSADVNANAKRCRFDDDFSAQYCNDFFSLPSTQIATQSCLMDTEEGWPNQQQQQLHHQQRIDEAMFENNNNNSIGNNNISGSVEKYEHSILNHQLQQQQTTEMQTQQMPPTTTSTQQQQQEQQQQQPYHHHQQQHYQDMIIINTTSTISKTTTDSNTISQPLTNTSLNLPHFVKNQSDIDVDADFKIDDAILFAQIHGGSLYHLPFF